MIIVDKLFGGFPYEGEDRPWIKKGDVRQWCHMTSTESVEELLEFGKSIGLKEAWLQKGRYIHFDLTPNKRKQAIKAGATEVTPQKLVKHSVAIGKKIPE